LKNIRNILVTFVMVLALFMTGTAYANTITPKASTSFTVSSVSWNSSLTTAFSATTKQNCESIKVTSVVLQKKSGSTWSNNKTLTAPTKEATNTKVFKASADYSGKAGVGTYRLKVVFNADGVTVTSYSNEQTLN